MSVTYEWDVEELEEAESLENGFDPDIVDHNFCDTYAEAKAYFDELGMDQAIHRIVLVRNVGNDVTGLTDRAWAYIEGGKLPERFTYGADEDSGINVPKRFHSEIVRG